MYKDHEVNKVYQSLKLSQTKYPSSNNPMIITIHSMITPPYFMIEIADDRRKK
jgi:hypothetical protein